MTILKAWQRSVVNRADQRMMCDGRLFRELSQNNRHSSLEKSRKLMNNE
jgi:hypothetical protein